MAKEPTVEQQYFAQLYAIADVDKDERISGAEGALFMRKSGVPDSTLEKIWDLADAKRTGYLLHRDFAIAMRLIALVQEGKSPSLDQIHNVTSYPRFQGIPSPVRLTQMTPEEVFKYDNLFLQADKNKDGFVDGYACYIFSPKGSEAREYFSKANVSNEHLAKIWYNLVYFLLDGDGRLSRGEFRVAMHLVYWILKGNNLPESLPEAFVSHTLSQPSSVQSPSVPNVQPVPPTTTSAPSFSDGFGSSTASSSGLTFVPSNNHNYDQSKLVHKYALPGASFEQRANFNSELSNAINQRKQ